MTNYQQKNIAICPDQIRMLMPMHIIVDAQGIITQMGRTIEKIAKASEKVTAFSIVCNFNGLWLLKTCAIYNPQKVNP